MKQFIEKIKNKENLSFDESKAAFELLMDGKAEEHEIFDFLTLLSGRRHRVTTAVTLRKNDLIWSRSVTTSVKMKNLSDIEISSYIRSQEWRGKAGGYAIQGIASVFIPFISGSYSNVVGLPLTETANLLIGAGYPISYEGVAL